MNEYEKGYADAEKDYQHGGMRLVEMWAESFNRLNDLSDFLQGYVDAANHLMDGAIR